MADRDKALEDYKAGLSYKEIANKNGVSESTIKSWAARYWNKDKKIKATRNKAKKLQPKTDKSCNYKNNNKLQKVAVEKHKRGAPLGNKNAVGFGAPYGNKNAEGFQNALKHGGYSKIYWDTLDDEEINMISDIDTDEEYQLEEQLRLYAVRERRILKAIQMLKSRASKAGDVEMSSSVFFTIENSEETVITSEGKIETKISSKPKATASHKDYEKLEFAVARLEKELTSVQRSKTKVINSLAELRSHKMGDNDEWLDDFFSAINEVDNEAKE